MIRKIIPKKLHRGDTIGIISPASRLDKSKFYEGVSYLEQMGFRVLVHKQNFERNNRFAGDDLSRKKAIEEMFANPEVKAIVCARGGYGALRIVDMLDYELIGGNPKIFIGYSDITALLIAIYQKIGLITYHGAMLSDLSKEGDKFTKANLINTLMYGCHNKLDLPKTPKPKVLREGISEGELIGGNLTILTNLIGTDTDFDTDNKILFIEDVNEYLYNFERMMLHIKRSGKLNNIRGLIVGEFKDMKDGKINFGKTTDEIIAELCEDFDFPIVYDFPCGHGQNKLILPIGISASLKCLGRGKESRAVEVELRFTGPAL